MARPKKEERKKRIHRLPHIRCTEDEYNSIRDRAMETGLSISEYVRQIASNGEVIIKDKKAVQFDFAFVYQLQKIGVNLNQAVKMLNRTGKMTYKFIAVTEKVENILDYIHDEMFKTQKS